ncbi:hypothetical protein [Candidatus Electrothrix sp.]|uniref:hypothetical protein n=1 Tax=Candidatus Electrothrix sp. TaxID=2170559 RepID=UPI0040577E1B
MKTLHLQIDNSIYGIILSMLRGLPRNKIKIIEEKPDNPQPANIMQFAGQLEWPVDGVEYQRELRD